MTDFHFLRPFWFLALPLLAALVWRLRGRSPGTGGWPAWCDADLLPHMLVGGPELRRRGQGMLLALVGVLAILALAGPAWERVPAPAFRNLSALVVVLDVSLAMDAADLKPNRLERARYAIGDLLKARHDGQSALVVYSGDAFTVTPLTDDSATITAQMSALSPALMPVAGNRADLGLAQAGKLLRQSGVRGGDILLVSGGDGAAQALEPARQLVAEGYRVSVLAVGTTEGGPVALPEGGFLKDDKGNIVVPRLDAGGLRALAETGSGLYREVAAGDRGIATLLSFLQRRVDADHEGETLHIEQWQEAGVWMLPLLLPLAAIGFRRGVLMVGLAAALAPWPRDATALEWANLWRTPEQRAQQAFDQGDFKTAADLFSNPEWKAAAQFRADQPAAPTLQGLDTARAQYNRGTALAKQGQLPEALEALKRAEKLSQTDGAGADQSLVDDARHNREVVEEALKKQQEKEQKKSDPSQSKPSKNDQNNSQDQQQKGSDEKQSKQSGQDQQGQDQQSAGQDGQEQGQQNDGDAKDPKQAQPAEQKPAEQESAENEKQQQTGADAKPGEQAKSAEKDKIRQALEAAKNQGPDEQTKDKAEPAAAPAATESPQAMETRQAEEQWLRRIPDDPGGLLKNKFLYQYRQRQQRPSGVGLPW